MAKPKKDEASLYDEELKRLNRVTGQIEGIRSMIGKGRELPDILIQFKAVHQALKSVESRLLRTHLRESVMDAFKSGKKKALEEVIDGISDVFKTN
jgi:DNA-binding FrmR family transcriptional regulator